MKSIFQQSFNAYKMDIEPQIGEPMLHCIRSSHRLFEIMLSHRRVTTAFLAEENIVVTVEGEAARMLNFDTGQIFCLITNGLYIYLYIKFINHLSPSQSKSRWCTSKTLKLYMLGTKIRSTHESTIKLIYC